MQKIPYIDYPYLPYIHIWIYVYNLYMVKDFQFSAAEKAGFRESILQAWLAWQVLTNVYCQTVTYYYMKLLFVQYRCYSTESRSLCRWAILGLVHLCDTALESSSCSACYTFFGNWFSFGIYSTKQILSFTFWAWTVLSQLCASIRAVFESLSVCVNVKIISIFGDRVVFLWCCVQGVYRTSQMVHKQKIGWCTSLHMMVHLLLPFTADNTDW